MNKEQLELMREIGNRLPSNDYHYLMWCPGADKIPGYPILDEGWCENWLLDTGDLEICNLKSRHKIEATYHYGKQPIREEADDLLTALLKLVLQVMKEGK